MLLSYLLSSEHAYRLNETEAHLPQIPCHPIGYGVAKNLLGFIAYIIMICVCIFDSNKKDNLLKIANFRKMDAIENVTFKTLFN